MKKHMQTIGNAIHNDIEYVQTERYKDLFELAPDQQYIAQGAGLSYVDASFGPQVTTLNLSKFDRLLEFSEGNRTIRVEPGITLGKLSQFLGKRGYYLPVLPGHPAITVGGCIAANVHGKNPTFSHFSLLIEEMTLYHPNKGLMTLSKSMNPKLFNVTCGGLGLTGIIIEAALKVQPLPNWHTVEHTIPVNSLKETITKLFELSPYGNLIYSWHKTCGIKQFGKGFISETRLFEVDEPYELKRQYNLLSKPLGKTAGKVKLFNRFTTPILQTGYHYKNTRRAQHHKGIMESLFPMWNKNAYYQLYGEQGLLEHQVLVPDDVVFAYVVALETLLRTHDITPPMLSLKRLTGTQRYLWFSGEGISFTFDFENTPASLKFLNELDAVNTEFGAITNVIKDSRLSQHVIKAQYPGYGDFRHELLQFDPDRIFTSGLAERIGL